MAPLKVEDIVARGHVEEKAYPWLKGRGSMKIVEQDELILVNLLESPWLKGHGSIEASCLRQRCRGE